MMINTVVMSTLWNSDSTSMARKPAESNAKSETCSGGRTRDSLTINAEGGTRVDTNLQQLASLPVAT
jgi:hypothetical protein